MNINTKRMEARVGGEVVLLLQVQLPASSVGAFTYSVKPNCVVDVQLLKHNVFI